MEDKFHPKHENTEKEILVIQRMKVRKGTSRGKGKTEGRDVLWRLVDDEKKKECDILGCYNIK